jgi:aspartate ammonia-lyase
MISTENLVNVLQHVEIFKDLQQDELKRIAAIVETKKYETGQILFKENTPRKSLFIIMDGQVELVKRAAGGEEKRLTFFSRFDFLGEGSLLDDSPHSTSARILLPSNICILTQEKFLELLKAQPGVSGKILAQTARVIAQRMRQTTTRVINDAAQYISGRTRLEHDLLGEREVPSEFYYGIQTLRGLENFNISGVPLYHYPKLIEGLAMVKMAAAKANLELGLLSGPIAEAIVQACADIINGKLHSQFVIDMIQGGAGTSTNMNANEVIANRALELLGYERGEYKYCHPNNHVNLSQSTNDVYPTALKLAIISSNEQLTGVLRELIHSFQIKGKEFAQIIKMGRTQLQDAVPMTLGQEFGAFAETLREEIERLEQNVALFLEVNMGGTAIGTGINTHPDYIVKVTEHLSQITGLEIKTAVNLVEATQDAGAFVMYSSALKRLAIKLSKISNDLRLLSSGPRTGLNEINLPKMQPGSSIMPGKVNPVIPEVVNQIAYKVIGNDLTVTLAAEAGQLQLNVMEPIIAECLFESIEILKNGMSTLKRRCIEGITANEAHCRAMVESSIGLVTALNPVLGYDVCTELAKEAMNTGRGVYELALDKKLLSKEALEELLKPENMIRPVQR